MNTYNVQITTDEDLVFILQVVASSEAEAEMTAIMMAESGDTEYGSVEVVDCFCV